MSVSASIDITYCNPINCKELLSSLLQCGWSANVFGTLRYIAPEHYEDSDWVWENYTDENLVRFLNSIEVNDKFTISLVIKKKTGGFFIFSPKLVMFVIDIYRKDLLKDLRFVNFTWYLKRMKPLLYQYRIDDVQCHMSLTG